MKQLIHYSISFFSTLFLFAEEKPFQLGVPFTDNMILQREAELPVWGFDQAGSKITVEFAGQKKTIIADEFGDWMLKLDSLKASRKEREMKISNDKGGVILLNGVLVGEVWFSSGQSNMVWTAGKSMCSDLAKEIVSSKEDVPIREISINTVSALYPQKRGTSDGGWKKASAASGFSALSLSFAHELYKELNVPIGILLSAHSNTRIEAFAQRKAIEAHPKLEEDKLLIHDADPLMKSGREAYATYYKDLKLWETDAGRIAEAGGKVTQRPKLPGIAGM